MKSTRKYQSVYHAIPNQDRYVRHLLQSSRHSAGVNSGSHIVLDEAALIARPTSTHPQRLFERRERTGPTLQVDDSRPQHRGDVDPGPADIERDQDPAKHRKRGEQEMRDQDCVSGDSLRRPAS